MNQSLVLIGIILVVIGMIVIIVGSIIGEKGKIEWGFGGFIGPIPFGWASSKPLLYLIIAISIIFLLVFLFFGLRLR